MKNLIVTALLSLICVSSFAADSLTYTQIILTKDSTDKNGLNYLASTMPKWCNGMKTIINFGSFDAAKYVENLKDGFYVCDGKFVVGKFNSPVQIFEITNCSLENADVVKGQCP